MSRFLEIIGLMINHVRHDDIAAINPDKVATSCPFCLIMISDGIKETDRESKIEAFDVIELLRKYVDI